MELNNTSIGIELGSTRIKAILLDADARPLASGSHGWENKLKNKIWTYDKVDIEEGLRKCFKDLKRDFKEKFGLPLTTTGSIGISGMMHGYLALDKNLDFIAEFRTWRNTVTQKEAKELSELFGFNIPMRWSIAHLLRAMRNGEKLEGLDYLTTLSGYIHTRLTGKRVLGLGDASGMFPIGRDCRGFDEDMTEKFNTLARNEGYSFNIKNILPRVLAAGEQAGFLTEEGARFLDPTGEFLPGIPLCPPEGDAGTGMVATNAIKIGTGNVSCGTSAFAMIVHDKKISPHKDISVVLTPDGNTVAMIQCNNCTSDINAWCELFYEFASLIGSDISKNELFSLLFRKALEGNADGGGLLSYNYISGEAVTDLDTGAPLFVRTPTAKLDLSSFMRVHLMSALATLKLGMRVLLKENIKIDSLLAHGGYFKTAGVGERILSAAMNCPISVMESAGEGGPYGMAILALFMRQKDMYSGLADFLDRKIFCDAKTTTVMASEEEISGFECFADKYETALKLEKLSAEIIK